MDKWLQSVVLTAVLLLGVVLEITAYSGGPPTASKPQVCGSMNPTGHGVGPQNIASPYTISLSQTCYSDGVNVMVEITGAQFKGYFVQARSGSDNTASYGMFVTGDSDQQAYSCFSATDNTIGHKNDPRKSSTKFYWQPGMNDSANITFIATIVQEKEKYWMNVMSEVLPFNSSCNSSSPVDTSAAPTTHYSLLPTVLSLTVLILTVNKC